MAKPSIFSRDYEKKMKRRKRRIVISILVALVLIFALFFKFKVQDMDFTNMKDKIQAWVDSGKPEEELVDEEEEVIEEPEKEVVPEKTFIDLNVEEGVILKAEYMDDAGVKKFVGIDPIEGFTYNISPSGEQILIEDKNQNLKVFKIDGTVKDITKQSYTSQSGGLFPKNEILAGTPEYIWHSQAKFINETRVLYISQLPYFGASATNKYIWIYDIENASENVLWNLKGPDTTVGELDPEKGLSVTVNGVAYYINADGGISQ
ncbi:hypothetical protein ACQPU1_13810 [Clostridium paraputrificum]|uniref:hypothetical protein n=1 Tax=Clostridium TaxID=1485 RepID=UPI003D32D72D